MKNERLNDRIGALFSKQASRHAMFMAGSVAMSYALGSPVPEMVETLHFGVANAISHTPFAPTLDAIRTYFDGGLNWLSSMGIGIADWIHGAGGEIGHRCQQVLTTMRMFLGDKIEVVKTYFDETISRSTEFAAFWRATIKDSLMGDPEAFLESAGKALTTVAEAFGVAVTLKEAYGWAVRKIFGRQPDSDQAPSTVTNLHVNISVAGSQDASEAVESIANKLSEATVSQSAKQSCGRPAPRDEQPTPVTEEGDIVDSSQVIWVSREFNKRLRDGVIRSLADNLAEKDMVDLKRCAEEIYKPIEGIQGGIIYSVTTKGDLRARKPLSAKMEEKLCENGQQLN
ncbi:hypothetical protein KUV57_13185 [Epibacterium sp. DP7N7-1]|nr:hypothetical protein [Epibacterium sp. DP7N7-1]